MIFNFFKFRACRSFVHSIIYLRRIAVISTVIALVLIMESAGYSKEEESSAKWIWSAEAGPANTWMGFKKQIDLGTVPPQLPAKIAADSQYWLWINGRCVVAPGGLKRGPTPSDTYADEVDLAPYLQRGPNTVAVLVWYWGANGSSHIDSGGGGFYLSCALPELCSNPTWRLRRQAAFCQGQQRPPLGVRPESPVIFDARLDDEPGWQEKKDIGTQWTQAVEKGVPPAKPWGRLIARPIPFFRYSASHAYVNASELNLPVCGPVIISAHLPSNLQVYPRLQVTARAGCRVIIQPEHSYEPCTYITREGTQSFEVPAWGNGNFVTYDIPEGVTVQSLDYRETGYDADFTNAFTSSNSDLNTLWTKSARSAYLNLRDSYMDCPDRERSAWPGDMANTSAAVSFVLDRRGDAITAKALREFLNWQSPTGVLWGAVPSGRFPKKYREFPAQSLALIAVGFTHYVMQTGDTALAKEAVPHIRRYLLECWNMDSNGLPEQRPAQPGWGAGTGQWMDWGKDIDRRLLETVWYAWALAGLDSLSQVAGLPPDNAVAERRRSIAAAFDSTFWDEQAHAYRSPGLTSAPDDRGNALAVCAGLALPQRKGDLLRLLSTRLCASIYMDRYPVDALFMLDAPDAALARIKRRYDKDINSPLSTLPELYGAKGLSTNHGWGAWPAATMVERIAGIRPTTPGYSTFVVEPTPGSIESFDVSFPSVRGKIGAKWALSAKSATLEVICPPGATAEVAFPSVQSWTAITCNGATVWPTPDSSVPVSVIPGSLRFQVKEGTWRFAAQGH